MAKTVSDYTYLGMRKFLKTPKQSRIKLFHRSPAFIGCFLIHKMKDIDYPRLRRWKDEPLQDPEFTNIMAKDLIAHIQNRYDYLATAPPNKTRIDLDQYCVYKLLESISKQIKVPFVRTFKRRTIKYRHGKYASLEQETPVLCQEFIKKCRATTVLWIDDFINTNTTARLCFMRLRAIGCHVDGLIYAGS